MSVDPTGSGTPMSERMQSLLARAVEDQMSEQRQLSGALSELRGQLQRVGDELAQLREAPPAATGASEAVAAVSADVREAVRLIGERLDGLAQLVRQRGEDLGEVKIALGQLQAAVQGQSDALAALHGGLSTLPALGDRLVGMQDHLAGLHERFGRLDANGNVLSALVQRTDALDQALRELRSAFSAVGARMNDLPARAEIDQALQRAVEPLEPIRAQLTRVEEAARAAGQPAPPTDDPSAEARHGQLRDDLAKLAAAVTRTSSTADERLAALEGHVQQVASYVAEQQAAAALEPAEPAEPADGRVLEELAALRSDLARRLEASRAEGDLDERVAAAVEEAVAGVEERLSAHIDEAVLALAEALLRRRTRPAAAAGPPAAALGAETYDVTTPVVDDRDPAQPAAPAYSADDETVDDEAADDEAADDEAADDEAPDDEALDWQAPDGDVAAADDDLADETASETAAEPDAAEETTEAGASWQTPPPWQPSTLTGPTTDEADNGTRRRRPWWRPGD